MRIFISYSKTREQVANLAKGLELLGHEVWFDQELIGAQAWWDEILQHILDCDIFIFALAPTSLDSYPCQLEYGYALALRKRLIPVMIEQVDTSLLPTELARLHIVNYLTADQAAAFALAGALGNLPTAQPLPDPLPVPPPVPLSPVQKIAERLRDPTTLTPSDQYEILFKLKGILDGKDAGAARKALEMLREREDVLGRVVEEIDQLRVVVMPTPTPPVTTSSAPPDLPAGKPPEHEGKDGHSQQIEAWTQQVLARLRGANFEQFSSLPSVSGINIHAGYVRREHEFVVQVDTVVTLAMSIGELTEEMIRAYSESMLQHAPRVKKGLPGGWGRAFLIYPVLVAERFDENLHHYVLKEYLPGTMTTINTGGTEFPVLVELATGRVTVRQDRPNQRGGGFKQPHIEVVELFKRDVSST